MSHITIKNLNKSYPSFSLSLEELKIEKGDFFGLIGPSGCGKTTLLKIIAGLEAHGQGSIFIDEKDITGLPAEKRKIGMVFQQPLLFPHMTVRENLEFGLKVQKIPKMKRSKRIAEVLNSVGLPNFEQRYPSQLSGGQQQRVAIARALVLQPTILLMDEPFSALDPTLREEMGELIKSIHQSYGITIVFVTHDRREAFTLFEKMAIIKEGEILQIGPPHEVYRKPSHPFVAEFLGCQNIFQGEVQEGKFYYKEIAFTLPHDPMGSGKAVMVLRPECIKVGKVAPSENMESLRGSMLDYRIQQGFQYMKIQIGHALFHSMGQIQDNKQYRVGEEVEVFYNPKDIWMIHQGK